MARACVRERGINPTSGKQELSFMALGPSGRRKVSSHAPGNRIVDGVFVPQGELGEVTLDSAGHTFDGFPRTNGKNRLALFGARGRRSEAIRQKANKNGVPLHRARRTNIMPNRRGLLGFHPNSGITFDLNGLQKNALPRLPAPVFKRLGRHGRGRQCGRPLGLCRRPTETENVAKSIGNRERTFRSGTT